MCVYRVFILICTLCMHVPISEKSFKQIPTPKPPPTSIYIRSPIHPHPYTHTHTPTPIHPHPFTHTPTLHHTLSHTHTTHPSLLHLQTPPTWGLGAVTSSSCNPCTCSPFAAAVCTASATMEFTA